MAGATLDTGVFIALERCQRRALALWAEWARAMTTLAVPAVLIPEWWRDRAGDAARWLGVVDVEPVDEALARIAGEVLGELRLDASTPSTRSGPDRVTRGLPCRRQGNRFALLDRSEHSEVGVGAQRGHGPRKVSGR